VDGSDSLAMLEHSEAAHEDRRSSELDVPFEELDVEIRPPPLRLRGARKDLSLVRDHVVAADDLVAVKAVASVVEIEFRCLAPHGSLHVADGLSVFTELGKGHREERPNCYEQTASKPFRQTALRRRENSSRAFVKKAGSSLCRATNQSRKSGEY